MVLRAWVAAWQAVLRAWVAVWQAVPRAWVAVWEVAPRAWVALWQVVPRAWVAVWQVVPRAWVAGPRPKVSPDLLSKEAAIEQGQAVREVRPKQIARMRALAKQWLVMSARPTLLS